MSDVEFIQEAGFGSETGEWIHFIDVDKELIRLRIESSTGQVAVDVILSKFMLEMALDHFDFPWRHENNS